MPAIRTNTTQLSPITAANFEASLHTAMLNAGFTLWHTYTAAAENRRIYREVFNTSTYGTAFYEIRINTTSRQLTTAAYTSFNQAGNTGANVVTSATNFTPNTTEEINYVALNGGQELRMVLIRQGSSLARLGQLRPALNKPSWWDENIYPYVWYIRSLTGTLEFLTAGGSALSPWNGNVAEFANRNIRGVIPGGQREICNGVALFSTGSTNAGLCGVCGDDLAQAATLGLIPGVDTLVVAPGAEEYLVVEADAGGLVVRVV